MSTNIMHRANLIVPLLLFTVGTATITACGSDNGDSRGVEKRDAATAPKREARAREVAKAWDGSKAAAEWREGYHPLGEAVQLPENGLSNAADERAYQAKNFVLRGELPADPPGDGRVQWKSGDALNLPLMEARQAYEALDRDNSPGPHLIVPGARLGEMTLVTTRGPATVPAWLFTLEGYDTPLKRVAVKPSRLPEPPIKPAASVPSGELWSLQRLVETAEDGKSITVVANHGSCDDGPAVDVLETRGSVVLSASIVGAETGPCTGQMSGKDVTVELARQVGTRIVLDAFTGRPVPYGEPNGPSPSWS
ncbi:hypothetical protein ABTZ58_38290 [Streptomyces sp. NPDC094143]|uniref:hypothetical protein n=1 Tax=Streptomyces sp. NPDC094143 TaxID=3155310 RepID=UPI0033335175